MAAPKSIYSWDLTIRKHGDAIFFDKLNYGVVDQATVNERMHDSSAEQTVDPINTPEALTREATQINHAFTQQVLQKNAPAYPLERPNPFVSAEEVPKAVVVGYLYRRFDLGEDMHVVVRCEVDAVLPNALNPDAEPEFLAVRALNEWDPKAAGTVDYRQKLDSQRGAVLASELKGNSFKLARWTVQALLSGVNGIRLGYVSRVHSKDSANHVILGTQVYKPAEFATQINVSMSNCWAILKHFISIVRGLPDGEFVLLKAPSKGLLNLYDTDASRAERKEPQEVDDEDDEMEAPVSSSATERPT
jgi:translation initiation factor 3 subunit D